jgi:hypothetical protein
VDPTRSKSARDNNSDLDLKSIHVEKTADVLGLAPSAAHADRMETIEGVEIDYTSNELKPVLVGIVQGNGNYVERVLGTLQPLVDPALAELRPLVQKTLSRRVFRHYLGFASSQLKAFESDGSRSAKKLLYVLRTALTGTHALLTGKVVIDVRELIDEHGFAEARELIEAKRAGETIALAGDRAEKWGKEVQRAIRLLIEAHERSILPVEPEGVAEVDAWLIEERRKRF